jgi:hypothetical protein
MSTTSSQAAESGVALAAKSAPPVSVSLATVAGMPVSEMVLWGTLIYTVLLIGHKLLMIWRSIMRPGKKND